MTPLLIPARSAIRASDASAYPSVAMVSTAHSTICRQRAVAMNDRLFWPPDSFFVRMVRF
jgi:hypothetical protein